MIVTTFSIKRLIRSGLSLSALFICACSLATPAFACSCAPPPPRGTPPKTMHEAAVATVSAYRNSREREVVFEGRVEHQSPSADEMIDLLGDPKAMEEMHRLVTFRVSRVYHGAQRETVTVETGFGGGDCGFVFETGKEYLVYGGLLENGNVNTGICTPTDLLEHAGPELRVLRGEPPEAEDLLTPTDYYAKVATKWRGSVCGNLSDSVGKPVGEIAVDLIQIQADSFASETYSASTKSDGSFCIGNVDPGKFHLRAKGLPTSDFQPLAFYPGVIDSSQAKTVEVIANHTTTGLRFRLQEQPLYTVRVRVLGPGGGPPPDGLQVVLMSFPIESEGYHEEGSIMTDGTASFHLVPAGHYFAAVIPESDSEQALPRSTWKPATQKIEVTADTPEIVLNLVRPD